MSQDLRDFGRPDYFEAEAIGVPGNRRFRLIAASGGRTASLWIERDQLRELVTSLQQVLAQVTGEDVLRPALEAPAPPAPPRAGFPEDPDIEFQVGPIALGYEEDTELIIVLAAPIEVIEVEGEVTVNEDAEPQFRCALVQAEVTAFLGAAERLLASGRPRCPFCGQPLSRPDEPHGCVKQNGHRQLQVN